MSTTASPVERIKQELPDDIADDIITDIPDGEQHARDHAPSEREFEYLLEGAREIEDYRSLEAEFVLFVCGRLGLRAGELCHMQEAWVDWEESRIEIPSLERCSCSYCVQKAQQKADVRNENALDDRYAACGENEVAEPGRSVASMQLASAADLMPTMWSPKTDAAEREVPYDWNTRVKIVLERFFDREDEWPLSRQVVNRRVTLAAEHAPHMDPDEIFPHALKAGAASHQAAKGLEVIHMKSLFGWSCFSTGLLYIQKSPQNLQRALRSIHAQ